MRVILLVPVVIALAACGPSAESNFIGDRIPDQCGANWPVCDTFAGCRLDNESYVEGKLPGSRKFIVHTNGQAHIEISMLVTNADAEGTSTDIYVSEPGCGFTYPPLHASGTAFFAESQNEAGTPFVRAEDVSEDGDHLILLDSDATADYLLKVEVTEQNPTN